MGLNPVREVAIEMIHVPEGQSRIARRFNAGSETPTDRVPKGRLKDSSRMTRDLTAGSQASPRDDGLAARVLLISLEVWHFERRQPGQAHYRRLPVG